MPPLENRAHEAYARARAEGLERLEAYVEAGYRGGRGAAARLGRRPDVAARIAELRERDPDIASPAAIVARLIRVAEACGALGSAAGLREARMALLEANRLQAELTAQGAYEDHPPVRRVPLTNDEWLEKFAPKPGA